MEQNIVKCTNRLCEKEYHIDFAKCPFCGTENPQISKLYEKIEQKRKASAQILELEKKLEEHSCGKYQSSYRLLVEGGYVKGAQINIWEYIPTYAYAIGLIAFIMFSISIALLIIPDYPYSEWLLWGIVTSITGLFVFISHILYASLMKKGFNVKPANEDVPPSFGTINSVGITCLGKYREFGEYQVSYVFFSLIFPLIPIGCFRVIEGPSTRPHREGAAWKSITPYKIIGSEKWDILEILHVYLSSWSIKILVLCFVWFIGMLLN